MANSKSFTPPPAQTPTWKRGMAAVVKPKNFKGTLKRLWTFTKDDQKGLMGILILSAITSITAMVTPYIIGKIIDAIKAQNPIAMLLILLLLCYVGDCIIGLAQGYFMAEISQKIIKGMRKKLLVRLNQLPIGFFDKRQHGDLMSCLTNDIDNISTTISDSLARLMQLGFTVIGVLLMMLYLNPVLTLITIVASILIFVMTKIITKHTRVLFKEQQNTLGRLNGHIEESISGIQMIKAYCQEEQAILEFETHNNALCNVGKKALIWSGFLMPLMNVINNLCFIMLSVAGGLMVLKGYLTVGIISSFLLYAKQFTRPLNEIANIYNTLQTAVAGAERIFEIFDEPIEIIDTQEAQNISAVSGDIIFENVSFGYQKEVRIIKGINFAVKAGSHVAIVGETGSGKTTLISLLARFYEVSSGRILLDGVDLKDYKRYALRECFGIVLQDAALFDTSIMENIRYGKKNATDEDVIVAAKYANIHGAITKLPKGYATVVGEDACLLSQGEKQLITIARAVLRNAPIMILDEATSSVDTRTEHKIKDAITRLTKDRTSFIIAHRLSTIRDCDCIIVLSKGEIAEAGSHKELLKKQGLYYQMHCMQCGNK